MCTICSHSIHTYVCTFLFWPNPILALCGFKAIKGFMQSCKVASVPVFKLENLHLMLEDFLLNFVFSYLFPLYFHTLLNIISKLHKIKVTIIDLDDPTDWLPKVWAEISACYWKLTSSSKDIIFVLNACSISRNLFYWCLLKVPHGIAKGPYERSLHRIKMRQAHFDSCALLMVSDDLSEQERSSFRVQLTIMCFATGCYFQKLSKVLIAF